MLNLTCGCYTVRVKYHLMTEAQKEKSRERVRRWAKANPERRRAWLQAWRKANPEKLRDQMRRHRRKHPSPAHGLSGEQLDARLVSQGGCCVICKRAQHSGRGWHGDHDHVTGRFRAVLCNNCNLLLGHARDNADVCRAAADYLDTHAEIGRLM